MDNNYYNYEARNLLSKEISTPIMDFKNVFLCPYEVITDSKYPFLRFLLKKNIDIGFEKIPIYTEQGVSDLLNYIKLYLYGSVGLNSYEYFYNNTLFDGFYEFEENLYVFLNITGLKLEINDIHKNSNLWFVLLDEIINEKHVCGIEINNNTYDFFIQNLSFCFLSNMENKNYENPVVRYITKEESRLNFFYTFGQVKENRDAILGPYYYYTDFSNAINSGKNDKYGVVRIALFIGFTKYIQNKLHDDVDESETKKMRLLDEKLDKNMEILTMRISDYDGKWTELYDSVYLGVVELDNGILLNKQLLVVKDYKQQYPLSFHYICANGIK